jgi:hypothetical protein
VPLVPFALAGLRNARDEIQRLGSDLQAAHN